MLMLTKSSVLANLRNGIPSDKLRSPFEPSSMPTHAINLALLGGLVVAFNVTAFSFDGSGIWSRMAALVGLVGSGLLARRYCLLRIATACEAFGLIGLNGHLVVWALGLLSATNLPLVDHLLVKGDAVLGFHWRTFALLFDDREVIFWLRVIYGSIQWQSIVLIIILCAKNMEKNCWVFTNSWVLSLAVTIFLFPFFPAEAAFIYFDVPKTKAYVSDFYPVMTALRNGDIRTIGAATMKGMVTFPSFHAASAVCLGWGFSKVDWLRWPFIALNLAMLIATIVIGGHYLVDAIAGVLIACGAIWISAKFVR
jgi:membrane-associated phospholipid phosphatase